MANEKHLAMRAVSSVPAGKVKSLKLSGIHNCCQPCCVAIKGAIATVDGVKIWVATQPRPQSAVDASTLEYRIYFELNGSVYTGAMIKDGTVIGGGHYRTDPSDATTAVYLDYQVRINSAATQSLAAGSLL